MKSMTRRVRACRMSAMAFALGLAVTPLSASPAEQPSPSAHDDFRDKLISLAAGPEGGSLAPIGHSLCEAINSVRSETLVRCLTVPSAGSAFNLHAVENAAAQMGMAQEDLAAAEAASPDGRKVRAVLPLYDAPIAVIVRKDAGISELAGIRRGVINLGTNGSGIRANASALIAALGLRESDFAGVAYMLPSAFEKAFCDGSVNVIVNALAQPAAQYQRLIDCGGRFIDIPPSIGPQLAKGNPWLRPMLIPAAMYAADQPEVHTLGVRTLLIAGASVDSEAVYRVVRTLRTHASELARVQPLLHSLPDLTQAKVDSMPIPLHEGARRAMQEVSR